MLLLLGQEIFVSCDFNTIKIQIRNHKGIGSLHFRSFVCRTSTGHFVLALDTRHWTLLRIPISEYVRSRNKVSKVTLRPIASIRQNKNE